MKKSHFFNPKDLTVEGMRVKYKESGGELPLIAYFSDKVTFLLRLVSSVNVFLPVGSLFYALFGDIPMSSKKNEKLEQLKRSLRIENLEVRQLLDAMPLTASVDQDAIYAAPLQTVPDVNYEIPACAAAPVAAEAPVAEPAATLESSAVGKNISVKFSATADSPYTIQTTVNGAPAYNVVTPTAETLVDGIYTYGVTGEEGKTYDFKVVAGDCLVDGAVDQTAFDAAKVVGTANVTTFVTPTIAFNEAAATSDSITFNVTGATVPEDLTTIQFSAKFDGALEAGAYSVKKVGETYLLFDSNDVNTNITLSSSANALTLAGLNTNLSQSLEIRFAKENSVSVYSNEIASDTVDAVANGKKITVDFDATAGNSYTMKINDGKRDSYKVVTAKKLVEGSCLYNFTGKEGVRYTFTVVEGKVKAANFEAAVKVGTAEITTLVTPKLAVEKGAATSDSVTFDVTNYNDSVFAEDGWTDFKFQAKFNGAKKAESYYIAKDQVKDNAGHLLFTDGKDQFYSVTTPVEGADPVIDWYKVGVAEKLAAKPENLTKVEEFFLFNSSDVNTGIVVSNAKGTSTLTLSNLSVSSKQSIQVSYDTEYSDSSFSSALSCSTTKSQQTAPTEVKAVLAENDVTVTWKGEAGLTYTITSSYVNSGKTISKTVTTKATVTKDAGTYTVSKLSSGTKYTFAVSANKSKTMDASVSVKSNEIITASVIPAATLKKVTVYDKSATIQISNWDKIGSALQEVGDATAGVAKGGTFVVKEGNTVVATFVYTETTTVVDGVSTTVCAWVNQDAASKSTMDYVQVGKKDLVEITITGLKANTSYAFTTTASSNVVNAEINTVAPATSKALKVKTAIAAYGVPADLKAENITEHSVDVSWTASKQGDNTASTYTVALVPESGKTITKTVKGTSVTMTGLAANTNYTVIVFAKGDRNGSMSESAEKENVKTAEELSKPVISIDHTLGMKAYVKVEAGVDLTAANTTWTMDFSISGSGKLTYGGRTYSSSAKGAGTFDSKMGVVDVVLHTRYDRYTTFTCTVLYNKDTDLYELDFSGLDSVSGSLTITSFNVTKADGSGLSWTGKSASPNLKLAE